MKMLVKIIWNIVLLGAVIQVALACNGYKAKILKSENCAGPDAVITIEPKFSANLNKNCELVPTGCVVNKAFQTAKGTYKVVKDGLLLNEGKMDMCSSADDAPGEIKEFMKMFGAPESCPVKEGKVCGNNIKVDVNKYKSLLSFIRGRIVVHFQIEHDTGKSCFHVEMEISKG